MDQTLTFGEILGAVDGLPNDQQSNWWISSASLELNVLANNCFEILRRPSGNSLKVSSKL